MKTLIIDNFDSFTYNLYQYIAELRGNPVVVRNNEVNVGDIVRENYSHIIISPGPGSPDNARDFGVCAEVIRECTTTPILGVCLGHQGIVHEMGGDIVRAPVPVHGKQSLIKLDTKNPLFKGLPDSIEAMRYHSLIANRETLPPELTIIAETTNTGLVMGVSHAKRPLFGIQFHPESIGTPHGKEILKNFLSIKKTAEDTVRHVHESSLNQSDAEDLLHEIISNEMSDDQIESVLRDMAQRGETVDEIVGMARAMREVAHPFELPKMELMDTCGTGGSGLPRMNISTPVAFVLAACGVAVAKHGNRGSGGRCGSFDLLEALGVEVEVAPHFVEQSLLTLNIGFLFAPLLHPAMKRVADVRKKMGTRTIFNLLGPLTNPASPQYHLMGTSTVANAEKLAHAASQLGYKRALVVVGDDGLDEVTLTGKTTIFELSEGKIRHGEFVPEDVGIARVDHFDEIAGGTVSENARIFELLMHGRAPRALQNFLEVNCAFGLVARGTVRSVADGLVLVRDVIVSGAGQEKFLAYRNLVSNMLTL